MSWDLAGSNYDKITMVLKELGFSTEEGLYEVYVKLCTENTLVVSPIPKDRKTTGAITSVLLEDEKTSYSIFDDFCCVVAKHSEETYFEFISDLEELKQKIDFLKNRGKDFESLYFVKGKEITLVPYDSLDEFIARRIRVAEEEEARLLEIESNGGPSWLADFGEGLK